MSAVLDLLDEKLWDIRKIGMKSGWNKRLVRARRKGTVVLSGVPGVKEDGRPFKGPSDLCWYISLGMSDGLDCVGF
jgi:hypothetical protein